MTSGDSASTWMEERFHVTGGDDTFNAASLPLASFSMSMDEISTEAMENVNIFATPTTRTNVFDAKSAAKLERSICRSSISEHTIKPEAAFTELLKASSGLDALHEKSWTKHAKQPSSMIEGTRTKLETNKKASHKNSLADYACMQFALRCGGHQLQSSSLNHPSNSLGKEADKHKTMGQTAQNTRKKVVVSPSKAGGKKAISKGAFSQGKPTKSSTGSSKSQPMKIGNKKQSSREPQGTSMAKEGTDSPHDERWDDHLDSRLRDGVLRHGHQWIAVAAYLKEDDDAVTLSPLECETRWIQVVSKLHKKGPWTPVEDALVTELVRINGAKKWSTLSQSVPGRSGKQCRERWVNHLAPDVKKGEWTEEEERILLEQHELLGNQWCKIAQALPGRSENAVKNRWNSFANRCLSQKNGRFASRNAKSKPKPKTKKSSGVSGKNAGSSNNSGSGLPSRGRAGSLSSSGPPQPFFASGTDGLISSLAFSGTCRIPTGPLGSLHAPFAMTKSGAVFPFAPFPLAAGNAGTKGATMLPTSFGLPASSSGCTSSNLLTGGASGTSSSSASSSYAASASTSASMLISTNSASLNSKVFLPSCKSFSPVQQGSQYAAHATQLPQKNEGSSAKRKFGQSSPNGLTTSSTSIPSTNFSSQKRSRSAKANNNGATSKVGREFHSQKGSGAAGNMTKSAEELNADGDISKLSVASSSRSTSSMEKVAVSEKSRPTLTVKTEKLDMASTLDESSGSVQKPFSISEIKISSLEDLQNQQHLPNTLPSPSGMLYPYNLESFDSLFFGSQTVARKETARNVDGPSLANFNQEDDGFSPAKQDKHSSDKLDGGVTASGNSGGHEFQTKFKVVASKKGMTIDTSLPTIFETKRAKSDPRQGFGRTKAERHVSEQEDSSDQESLSKVKLIPPSPLSARAAISSSAYSSSGLSSHGQSKQNYGGFLDDANECLSLSLPSPIFSPFGSRLSPMAFSQMLISPLPSPNSAFGAQSFQAGSQHSALVQNGEGERVPNAYASHKRNAPLTLGYELSQIELDSENVPSGQKANADGSISSTSDDSRTLLRNSGAPSAKLVQAETRGHNTRHPSNLAPYTSQPFCSDGDRQERCLSQRVRGKEALSAPKTAPGQNELRNEHCQNKFSNPASLPSPSTLESTCDLSTSLYNSLWPLSPINWANDPLFNHFSTATSVSPLTLSMSSSASTSSCTMISNTEQNEAKSTGVVFSQEGPPQASYLMTEQADQVQRAMVGTDMGTVKMDKEDSIVDSQSTSNDKVSAAKKKKGKRKTAEPRASQSKVSQDSSRRAWKSGPYEIVI